MSKEREMLVKVYRFLKSNIEDDFAPDSDVRVLADHIRELLTHPKQDLREEQEPVAWMCNLLGDIVTYKPNVNNGYTPLYASPQKREPPQTAREMYQRGYAAAERDSKREPLSDDEMEQTTKNMSEFAADMFKAGVVAAEKAHGIGGGDG